MKLRWIDNYVGTWIDNEGHTLPLGGSAPRWLSEAANLHCNQARPRQKHCPGTRLWE